MKTARPIPITLVFLGVYLICSLALFAHAAVLPVEIGLAMVDGDTAEADLSGITRESFANALNTMALQVLPGHDTLRSEDGRTVTSCTLAVGPPRGDTMVLFLALPWAYIDGLVQAPVARYDASITAKLTDSATGQTLTRRFPREDAFSFSIAGTSGRRLYYRYVGDLGSYDKFMIYLTINAYPVTGQKPVAHTMECDLTAILPGLKTQEGYTALFAPPSSSTVEAPVAEDAPQAPPEEELVPETTPEAVNPNPEQEVDSTGEQKAKPDDISQPVAGGDDGVVKEAADAVDTPASQDAEMVNSEPATSPNETAQENPEPQQGDPEPQEQSASSTPDKQ